MKLAYPACFYQSEDKDIFVVDIPDFKCATQGRGIIDAIDMAEDAIAGLIITTAEEGGGIPKPSAVSSSLLNPADFYENGFVTLVMVDMDKKQREYNKTLVKKTLGIPAYLNFAAEKQGINFSATLSEALLAKLEQ